MTKTRPSTLGIFAIAALASLAVALKSGEAKAADWFSCQIIGVFELGPSHATSANTIQVQCANSITTGVSWIALQMNSGQNFAVTNVEKQNRFLSLAQAALLSGRRFRVWHTDTSCPGFSACRLVTAWGLIPP